MTVDRPNIGVVIFPGSNCDTDSLHGLGLAGANAIPVWHDHPETSSLDGMMIPGGFSYGDYLRTGAIAQFSTVMGLIRQMADDGRPVLGVCNGFQILLEAGLLPGGMLRNRDMKFICRTVQIRLESTRNSFSNQNASGDTMRIPIAHGEGNYYADPKTLAEMNSNGQVAFRYCDNGIVDDSTNPNGSSESIAGVTNAAGNVLGMMPHPERALEPQLGSTDGLGIMRSMVESCISSRAAINV